jgi:hypothetical protein
MRSILLASLLSFVSIPNLSARAYFFFISSSGNSIPNLSARSIFLTISSFKWAVAEATVAEFVPKRSARNYFFCSSVRSLILISVLAIKGYTSEMTFLSDYKWETEAVVLLF